MRVVHQGGALGGGAEAHALHDVAHQHAVLGHAVGAHGVAGEAVDLRQAVGDDLDGGHAAQHCGGAADGLVGAVGGD